MAPCLNCEITTSNPKFCSQSCAALYNNRNRNKPIKATKDLCSVCGVNYKQLKSESCYSCFLNHSSLDLKITTLGDVINDKKHARSKYNTIRSYARKAAALFKMECSVCSYNLHVEVCHVKPIKDFYLTDTLAFINSLSNLTLLCRNHHWELDHHIGDINFVTLSNAVPATVTKKPPVPRAPKIKWPPTEELINLVKKSNFLQASYILGVSDNAIRKHLKKNGVNLITLKKNKK